MYVRAGFLAIGAVAMCGCGLLGPSESLEGLWLGKDPGGASYPARVVYLNLRQTGDTVTGIACYSFERRENVGSRYPYVKVASGWEGKLERSGEIVSTKISDIERFVRTDSQPSYC